MTMQTMRLHKNILPLVSFFFSSRRRHTRSKRDWSSDVCSSDLQAHELDEIAIHILFPGEGNMVRLEVRAFAEADADARIAQLFDIRLAAEEVRLDQDRKSVV